MGLWCISIEKNCNSVKKYEKIFGGNKNVYKFAAKEL